MARVSSYPQTEPHPDATLLTFPEKLWWIVNNPKHDEIQWDAQGTSIVIPNTQRFVSEILNNPLSVLFKTNNFSSFVRQLNLYGFRKVTDYPRRTLSMSSRCEFKHTCFRKGRRDLLLHVKRQLYPAKKTLDRQQRNCVLPPKENHIHQHHGSASLNASWNPTLYTPVPLVPWQAPLQMPFTLYAPFCNPYQLALMQQGPTSCVPNVQACGQTVQFQPGLTDSSVLGTQNSGPCERGVKSPVSSPPTDCSRSLHPQAAVQHVSLVKSTVIAAPNSAPNAVTASNASIATASLPSDCLIANNIGLTQGSSDASAAQDNEQGTRSSIRRESTEVCFAGSRPFAAHVLGNKEAKESVGLGLQSSSLKPNEDGFHTGAQDLCH